jgi:hypothetical protein
LKLWFELQEKKNMNRLDRIEKTKFLGREFLLWLWYTSEINDGIVALGEDNEIEIAIDDRIVLEPIYGEGSRHLLSGIEPSHTPEAAFALQMNKLPSEIKIKIIEESRAWSFSMRCDDLLPRSLRIPEVLSQHDDDYLYERIYLIEEIESIIEQLWTHFIGERISAEWPQLHQDIQQWIKDKSHNSS